MYVPYCQGKGEVGKRELPLWRCQLCRARLQTFPALHTLRVAAIPALSSRKATEEPAAGIFLDAALRLSM